MESAMFSFVRRISVLFFVVLFVREAESQDPTFTSVPLSPVTIVEGESVTLKWTYNIGGGGFREAEFDTQGVTFVVDRFRQEAVVINSAFVGRVTANITETNASITFLAVNRNDSGTYTFRIENEDRRGVERALVIDVQFKPEDVQLTTNVSANKACLNDVVFFYCSAANANPPAMYHFFENDVLFGSSSSGMFSKMVMNGGNLTYKCVANNTAGTTSSQNVSITVNDSPGNVQLMTNATASKACQNDVVSFMCSADAVPSAMSFQLFKDNVPMETSDSGMWAKPLSEGGVFAYKCVANNSIGSASSTNVSITVNVPASIQSMEDQFITESHNTSLFCNTSGTPQPTVFWINVASGQRTNSSVLEFTNINRSEAGEYRCEASNECGSASEAVNITVQFPPSIEPLGERKVVIRGESLTLFCNVSGKPAPVVFWTHVESNDKLSDSTWEIKFATERDVGRYRCNATNIYGHASDTIEILLLQAATPFSTTVSSNTGMLNKDAIYGPVIGIMGLIVISALIYLVMKYQRRHRADRQYDSQKELHRSHLNQGFQNESGNNGEREIPGPRRYMELGEVTEFPGESAETGTEASPYLEINEYAPLHPATRSWEVPRKNVTIEKVIGKGAFGQVAQGTASELRGRDGTTRVAIKMLKDNARETDREDLMSELEVMKKLKPHPNVIKLMGCVTESDGILVIIEYVPYGDLLGYLRKSRGLNDTYFKDPDVKPQTSLTSQQLMKFSWHVAEGMRYLSSKKIIHRDLAARNVLVGEQEVCKVTDFGMARDVNQENIYQKKSKGRIPVKWTAYEALLYGLYTTKSDVWSFGIVLYEIFTVGGSPYPRTEGRKMHSLLAEGYRMPKPSHVDDTLYQIMLSCWQENPDNRPTFELLGSELKKMENQHKRLINMNDYDKKLYENVEDLII